VAAAGGGTGSASSVAVAAFYGNQRTADAMAHGADG